MTKWVENYPKAGTVSRRYTLVSTETPWASTASNIIQQGSVPNTEVILRESAQMQTRQSLMLTRNTHQCEVLRPERHKPTLSPCNHSLRPGFLFANCLGTERNCYKHLVFVFLSCSIIAAWWCYEVRGMSRPRAWQNTGALLYVSSAMVKTLQDTGTVKGRYRYPLRFQPHLGFAQLILQHCPGAEGTAQMQIQQLWIPCSVVILRLHTWTQIDL